MSAPVYGVLTAGDLVWDPREVAARLHASPDWRDDRVEECRTALESVLDVKYAWREVAVTRDGNRVTCGFGPVESRALSANLKDCRRAYLMAVTLGPGVDRLLTRLSLVSPAGHFITDALASAAAEGAMEALTYRMARAVPCRPRFSPGYGDLPLTVQPMLLELLDAGRRLGVTLNPALLMAPTKTITAVMGVEP